MLHQRKIERLGGGEGAFDNYTQNMHYHYADDYVMKATDLEELAPEYDPSTEEGRAREEQYQALKEKHMKLFDKKHKEILLQTHNTGHVTKPMDDYLSSKKKQKLSQTGRLTTKSSNKNIINVATAVGGVNPLDAMQHQ